MASRLEQNEIELDEVVTLASIQSLARSILAYLEYLRTGSEVHLAEAKNRVQDVISLALEARFVDIWWLRLSRSCSVSFSKPVSGPI